MPSALPVCMSDGIWKVLPSRIRLATAWVTTRISSAATRPPPFFFSRVWATTPLSDSDSMTRICSWRSVGN